MNHCLNDCRYTLLMNNEQKNNLWLTVCCNLSVNIYHRKYTMTIMNV